MDPSTVSAEAGGEPSRLRSAGAFVRMSTFGVTGFMVLLGAASGAGPLQARARPLAAAFVLAAAFHVFAYVGNDVVDLRIDRTAPARAASPLVRGTVRPAAAAAAAAAMVPAAGAAAWWGGGGAAGEAWLLAACALMLLYNLWGKRGPAPPVTDLAQGLGWAALSVAGACLAGGPGPGTGWLAAFLTVYIVLANGVHGSIRDVRNDSRHQVRSTAILLGARPGPGRSLRLPRRVAGYAYGLQAALTGLSLAAAAAGPGGPVRTAAQTGAVAALSAVSLALLRAALGCAADERLLWSAGALHLIATFTLPVAFLAGGAPRWLAWTLVVLSVVPFAANGWLRKAVRWGWWRHPELARGGSAASAAGSE